MSSDSTAARADSATRQTDETSAPRSFDLKSALAAIEEELERSDVPPGTSAPTAGPASNGDRGRAIPPIDAPARTAGVSSSPAAARERQTAVRPQSTDASAQERGRRAAATREQDATRELSKNAEHWSRLSWFIGVSDASPADPSALTYEPFFGLREKPFSLASDPRFFYSHASHGAAFDTLAGGIRRREGVLVLTGEVGTGKTTLCRAVVQSLDQKTFAAYVPDPFLSREDLLKTLLVDFGVVSVDDIRSGRLRGASRTDLSYPLYDFLASLQPLKAFAVVIIDEAQNLTTELLEEIRILSDLENRQKLLEVVLVGQPELRSRLATPEMRQLRQRVSIRSELAPLAPADVQPYISRRLLIAGNDGRVQFTRGASETISAASDGIPRVINLVCDRALLRAARSRSMTVDSDHVLWAVDDLQLDVDLPSTHPSQYVPVKAPPLVQPIAGGPLIHAQSPVVAEPHMVAEPQTIADPWIVAESPGTAESPAIVEPPMGVESPTFVAPAVSEPSPDPDRHEIRWEPAATASVFDQAEVAAAPVSPQPVASMPLADLVEAAHVSEGTDTPADFPVSHELVPAVAPRSRSLALAGSSVVLAAALAGYWYLPSLSHRSANVVQTVPAVQLPSPPAPPAEPLKAEPAVPPPVVPAAAAPSARADSPAPAPSQGVGDGKAAAKHAIQIATFESSTRAAQALKQFREAGYPAYSVEMRLRDGKSALAVFLGPYSEQASADRDLARARQIPGYGTAWVVQVGPSLLPPESQR